MTLAKNKPSLGTSDTKKSSHFLGTMNPKSDQISTIDFEWKNLPKGDKTCWLAIIGGTDNYQSIWSTRFWGTVRKADSRELKFNLAAHRHSYSYRVNHPFIWEMVGAAPITLGLCAAKSRSIILKKKVRKLDFVEFLRRHHQRRTVNVLT